MLEHLWFLEVREIQAADQCLGDRLSGMFGYILTGYRASEASRRWMHSARLPRMPLIIILIILVLIFGGGGYYMGPGIGYYGGGAIDVILIIVIIFLLLGRGRRI